MLRFTPRAREDLRAILSYIDSENPAAAERVRRATFKTLGLIAERPYLGIRNARAADLRSRLVGRYPASIIWWRRDNLDRPHPALCSPFLGC